MAHLPCSGKFWGLSSCLEVGLEVDEDKEQGRDIVSVLTCTTGHGGDDDGPLR